jgi:hypothetical protein
MVYKTRKTNKRRYLQKRKTRKMYGGDPNDVIVEEKKEEVPTVMSNVEDAGQLAVSALSNVAAEGLQSAAEAIGVDPNQSIEGNIKQMGDKVEDINNALNSPEGEQLKEETGKLLADSIKVLEPSIKEAENIAKESLVKLGDTGTGILVTAMNEIPPIFLINEMSKFGTAAVQAGEAVAELTTTGTQAIESLEEQKRKASSLWERGTNFIENLSTDINKNISDRIASTQESVNKEGKRLVESSIPKVNIPQMNSSMEAAGGSIKKLHKEALMIGGRSRRSHLYFLAPHVHRSQILRQYGGKWQTKRRNKNRRHASRRH